MNCTNCGTENPEQAIFCIRCGKQIQDTGKFEHASPIQSARTTAQIALHENPIETWRTAISSSAKWIRRIAIPLVTLAWIALAAVILWAASHIGRSLILLAIAALLAVALAPAVKLATRVIPRMLAILVVYLAVLIGLGIVIYFLSRTTIQQVSELRSEVMHLLQPNAGGQATPLEVTLQSLGIDQAQIQEARQIVVSHLANLAN
ncbi:MAG: AI-2E family transporter, partial [Ktedonobacteraceae bacterium]